MAAGKSNREVEIKLPLDDLEGARRRLRRSGYRIIRKRCLEINVVFDTPAGLLRRRRQLLRLRRFGPEIVLTYKGPPAAGRHKSREEIERAVSDFDGCAQILERLGYVPAFRYEKYRTIYAGSESGGAIMLDETPIGDFWELEGRPSWIDTTARSLGFRPQQYITASYGALYIDYCRRHRKKPSHMVFPARKTSMSRP